MSDEDRIAYLAGDFSVTLDPADAAELDDLRALLADESLWVEPDPGLADRVLSSITDAAAQSPPLAPVVDLDARRARRIRYAVVGVAAAVLLAVGVALGVGQTHSHPVRFAAALAGTDLASGASGQATLTQTTGGWRIQLHATGLPRLDNGSYYEAWLKNADGVLVPVGTFNQPTGVTLWAGVAPTSFPTLTVTRQTVGGGAASSGQVVLKGTATQQH